MNDLLIAFPNNFTYSETFIKNQVEGLKPKITLTEGWQPSIQRNGKSFLWFPLNFLLIRGFLRNLFPQFYHRLYTKSLSRYLVKQNIRVVLANYGPMGAMLMDACKKANVDLVVHFHGFDASDKQTIELFFKQYNNLFKIAKSIVVVSKDMVKKLIDIGADANKLILNPYGIKVDYFVGAQPELNPPVFIAVGRFTEKKAPLLTIKAFAKLLNRNPKAKLVMVGDGDLLDEAKLLVKDLKIQDEVSFKGVLNPDEIIELLKLSRVFVQHSIQASNGDSEGTPNTILEASASGLPVISTFHAGIKEAVLHEKTGYLVNEGDWQTMGDYMIKLASNPTLCAELGKAGRKHMLEHYNYLTVIVNLKKIIQA